MRIAVIGGTGLVGRYLTLAIAAAGHEPVVVARSTGVDAVTGHGLRDALAGAQAVVDVTNTADPDPREAGAFFTAVTRNVMTAEKELGIGHHVVLSIVGVDRVRSNAHYLAKVRQEEAALAGHVGVSIVRATQFFEFAEMVVTWTRNGDTATVPPLLMQPAAVADVALELLAVATGAPGQGTIEVAGPRREDLVDMTRRILHARGRSLILDPAWRVGPFDVDMAGEVPLPGADARITPTDLDAWLTYDTIH